MAEILAISPKRIELYYLQAPVETPVKTSFGTMTARPAVFVRVEDADGTEGWGEIWCNHPSFTGGHRLRLAADVMAPKLIGRKFASPEQATEALTKETWTLRIQCAEPGPHAQVIAGFDTAFWDLAARRAGKPLCAMLAGEQFKPPRAVPAYASGINPDGAPETIARARGLGYRAFKMKIGFGRDTDIAAVDAARDALQPGESLMLDANQAWDLKAARDMASALANLFCNWFPEWLEEPLLADATATTWAALKESCRVPLAGGENLLGMDQFDGAINAGALSVIQPDVAKWGGVTGCRTVGQRAIAAGRRYCPHFLGGAVGLAASAHLLAAVGGTGLLEVDVNPNPLRDAVMDKPFEISDGAFRLPDGPGLSVAPNPAAMAEFQTDYAEIV